MSRFIRGVGVGTLLATIFAGQAGAQQALTWDEVKAKFEANNPTLRAGQIGIDESKASEITAYLRPNPQFTLLTDGTQIAPYNGVWQPFSGTMVQTAFAYLHERDHKRELRRDSAVKGTGLALEGQADLQRTLLFSLRSAFVQALESKAVLSLAKENLTYYDKVLEVNRERYKVGGISQMDLDRLELQRIQYLSDLQTAEVNLRTAKIQLLSLLNDRTPVEQFEVAGPYDFVPELSPLDNFRQDALATRPDLKAAIQSIDKAETDHKLAIANGSTDPTLSAWYAYNPSFNNPNAHDTLGVSVGIPLRIFDRNQGEKLRTQLDIARQQRLADAARAQVYNDVDSAYATVNSTVILLKPYKQTYLQQAAHVRETVSFAYEHGGASLLDFLDAQKQYRDTELNYLNLVGSYMVAAAQLNLAVGREVLQ
jgi:outer membrane protein, heavy metal efflux system